MVNLTWGGYPVSVVPHQDEQGLNIPRKSERKRRIHALVVSLVAMILLSVAVFLTPSVDGIGTHAQLGLPQCGWIAVANLPCPTCGMTTAWSHTVRGEFSSAFMTQPMGMLLALMTVFIAIGSMITVCTGYSFQPLLYRFPPSKIFILVIVLTLTAWGFKILLHRGVL